MSDAKRRPLEAAEIETALYELKEWSSDENGLKRKLVFQDFRGAMKFMQACIEGIEQRNHHPSWCNTYNSVDIQLTTHDAGNRVTEKDLDLAKFLDSVLRDGRGEFGYVEEAPGKRR